MTGYCPICGQAVTDLMVDGSGWCPDDGHVFVNWERPFPKITVLDVHGERIARGMETIDLSGRPDGLVVEVQDETDERGPRVVVEYFDGTIEKWGTTWLAPEDDHRCMDVEVRP